jgi:ssRNA-specific RNase YbeY (16S rRNA maturation enzyme)
MNSRSSAKSAAKGIPNSEKIKEAILGKKYELSLVICGNALSHTLNLQYRGKDKPTNVLAFPLSKNSGEIFINRMHLDGFSLEELFIHALLHLKGMEWRAHAQWE